MGGGGSFLKGTSAVISHEHSCIFIHIPKTAGTSIEKKLGHFDELTRGVQDHRPISVLQPFAVSHLVRPLVRGRPVDAARWLRGDLQTALRGGKELSRAQYESYFKFTFVRNPWARVYSWYRNVVRDETHRRNFGIAADCPFDIYVRDHLTQWAIRPQLQWLTDRADRVVMDFIGRFERLEEDFERVCDVLNLGDASLPRLVAGGGDEYQSQYDERSRAIVASRYREEIERFGFEFGE